MAQGGQPIFILPEGTNRSIGRDAQRNNILAGKVLAETVRKRWSNYFKRNGY